MSLFNIFAKFSVRKSVMKVVESKIRDAQRSLDEELLSIDEQFKLEQERLAVTHISNKEVALEKHVQSILKGIL